jgi:hypothetical protein
MKINIVTYGLKARSSEREETAVARDRLGKHVPVATDTRTTIEKLLEVVFSVGYVLGLYNKAVWTSPVSLLSAQSMRLA